VIAKRRILLPLAVLLAGLAVAGLLLLTRPQVAPVVRKRTAPLVQVLRVQLGSQRLVVRTQGEVAPRSESDLVPEVSGAVRWISPNLVSGGFFEADEPLLRIDELDYQVALEEARANLARAQSEAARAAKERRRQRSLARRNAASASRLDDAENGARVADAVLRQARAALARAERDMARTEIRAPYAGRVREEHVDLGQFVSRGKPVAKLYAIDTAEVRLPIGDEELAYLGPIPGIRRGEKARAPGPLVRLFAEFAGARHEWQGRVVRTEGEIDPRSRMVNLVAQVEDPYGQASGDADGTPLAVGLFVEAEIQGREIHDAVRLPRDLLRDGDQVWLVDEKDRLRMRPVKVAWRGRDDVVVSSGLVAGDRVCTSQLAAAVDGMRVRTQRSEQVARGDEEAAP